VFNITQHNIADVMGVSEVLLLNVFNNTA